MHEQHKALDGERTSEWTRTRAWAPECRLAHMARHMFVRRNNSQAAGRPGRRAAWRPPADERSSGRAGARASGRTHETARAHRDGCPHARCSQLSGLTFTPFGIPTTETTRACCTARAPAKKQRSAPGELGSPEQRRLGTPTTQTTVKNREEAQPRGACHNQ